MAISNHTLTLRISVLSKLSSNVTVLVAPREVIVLLILKLMALREVIVLLILNPFPAHEILYRFGISLF